MTICYFSCDQLNKCIVHSAAIAFNAPFILLRFCLAFYHCSCCSCCLLLLFYCAICCFCCCLFFFRSSSSSVITLTVPSFICTLVILCPFPLQSVVKQPTTSTTTITMAMTITTALTTVSIALFS